MPAMNIAGNFFLIGMMGAGKTTVGRLLSHQLSRVFYDSDQEIEKRTGVKISTIFDIEGEARFREREASTIADLAKQKNIVLATGGGAVLHNGTRSVLRSNGIVIYLRASVDDLYERTQHDNGRPLLFSSEPRAILYRLFMERDQIYKELSDLIVETGSQSIPELINQIDQQLSFLA